MHTLPSFNILLSPFFIVALPGVNSRLFRRTAVCLTVRTLSTGFIHKTPTTTLALGALWTSGG